MKIEAHFSYALWGLILGFAYFSSLWWTVRRCVDSKHPALLLISSYVVRNGVLIAALMLTHDQDWVAMLVMLAGIVVARIVIVYRLGWLPTVGSVR